MSVKTANSVQQLVASVSGAAINLGAATNGNRTLALAIAETGAQIAVGSTNIAFRMEDDAGAWKNGKCTISATGQVTQTSITNSSANGGEPTFASTGRKLSLILDAAQIGSFVTVDDGIAPSALASAGAAQSSDIIVITRNGVELALTAGALATLAGAAPDTTAPTATASAVANGSPTIVNVTMSEALDPAFVPAAAAFTVGGHTVSAVAISGAAINLTLSAPFVNGEAARTLAYTQPGTNNARDLAGILLANFSRSIVNNVGDSTAPGFASAQVLNSAPSVIEITMNEALNSAFVPVPGAFLVSGGKTVTGVAISGAVISLTCSAAYANGDTITAQYVKPGSGNTLRDASGNATASFGPSGVTNNVQAAVPSVVYQFNGPVFSPLATSASFGGQDLVAIGGDFQIRTAAGVGPDDASVDVYVAFATSSTVMARPNDANHSGLAGSYLKAGRIGAGNAAYDGDYGLGSLYTYRTAGGGLADRRLHVIVHTNGADPATATPIWWGVYDGNHTGTPHIITMSA